LTPAPLARLIARQFHPPLGHIRLLDPGAGVGALTAAFVERVLEGPTGVQSCQLTAYEIDPLFVPRLQETLAACCTALEHVGIVADYHLHHTCFIHAGAANIVPSLFNGPETRFTHTVLNPPYKKIHSQSTIRKTLADIGIETVNLYSAFVWLAMLQLDHGGELTAITPRSFCNGAYFRPFRAAFLRDMALEKMQVFDSRSAAFAADEVLQENIVFHAIRKQEKPVYVTMCSSTGDSVDELPVIQTMPYAQVVRPNDPELFIHIVTDGLAEAFKKQMEALPATLDELGLQVSTGPVVDFRLRAALRDVAGHGTVPLLYPESLRAGAVIWPPAIPRKPVAITRNATTEKWLTPQGWYVLTKRFSAKEEQRRIVAAVCAPFDTPALGIENHLNYYHAYSRGIDADLARGLAVFLNSTLCDTYFRQFSGHTQVNATDLRTMRYPHKEDLIILGRKVGAVMPDQVQVDHLIHDTLPLMDETTTAFQAKQRLQEALAILKDIAAPRAQRNERSALCLLALADIRPATPWSQAQAPLRRITEMMEWFKDHYGKQYAPNTRETVRRQTMHQFVQMGLVSENPDNPSRPINSPQWCYRLQETAVQLLRAYDSMNWETVRREYAIAVANILQERQRMLPIIPVTLPDGRAIELSSGGQNALIKDILEQFCPRFTPGGMILYVGDAGDRYLVNETRKMQEMGLILDPRGKMPGLVVYHVQQDWLVLVEAVTSHGPVNLKRHNELKQLFQASGKGLVFVTAFPSRNAMTRYLADISWETEVWVADQPDHMIHFNGERFLGPYNT
jgi:adenine-specific DNA-methyltransferase